MKYTIKSYPFSIEFSFVDNIEKVVFTASVPNKDVVVKTLDANPEDPFSHDGRPCKTALMNRMFYEANKFIFENSIEEGEEMKDK